MVKRIMSVAQLKKRVARKQLGEAFTMLFSILPNDVKFAKELTHLDKMVFAYIQHMTGKTGYFYHSNEEIARDLLTEPYMIKAAIEHLTEKQYVYYLIEKTGAYEIRKVYLYTILGEKSKEVKHPSIAAQDEESVKGLTGGIQEAISTHPKRLLGESEDDFNTRLIDSILYNSTNSTIVRSTSTNSTKYHSTKNTSTVGLRTTYHGTSILSTKYEQYEQYCNSSEKKKYVRSAIGDNGKELTLPQWLGKGNVERLITLFSICWEIKYGVPCHIKPSGTNASVFSSLLRKYTEVKVGMMILVHFDWAGPKGDNPACQQYLRKHMFSLQILQVTAGSYWQYVVHKKKIASDEQGFLRIDKFLHDVMENPPIMIAAKYEQPVKAVVRDDPNYAAADEVEQMQEIVKSAHEAMEVRHEHQLIRSFTQNAMVCTGCPYIRYDFDVVQDYYGA